MEKENCIDIPYIGRITAITEKGKEIISDYKIRNSNIIINDMINDKINFSFQSKDMLDIF